jgi:Flp pilus assembly protein TadG
VNTTETASIAAGPSPARRLVAAARLRMRRATRASSDQRGSVLVEAALIIPVILLLTFGAIEFGFAFNEQGTVRAATRTAARAASTQPKATDAQFEAAAVDTLNASVKNLVNGEPDYALIYDSRNGTYEPSSPGSCTGECVYYDWNGTTFTKVSGSWPAASRAACAGASDRVGVFLKVHHEFITGLFTDTGLDLAGRTVMALEPTPDSNTCGGA